MSAPLLLTAMLLERRAARRPAKRYLLARCVVALFAGCTILALSSPSSAAVLARQAPSTGIQARC